MNARRAILWFALVAQLLGGVLGFSLGADHVFVGIGNDALARLCLRLAAWSHASMALLMALFLVKTREDRWLRWLAAAAFLYQLLAGIESLVATMGSGVMLAGPPFGFVALHASMLILLGTAAFAPQRRATAGSVPRCAASRSSAAASPPGKPRSHGASAG